MEQYGEFKMLNSMTYHEMKAAEKKLEKYAKKYGKKDSKTHKLDSLEELKRVFDNEKHRNLKELE